MDNIFDLERKLGAARTRDMSNPFNLPVAGGAPRRGEEPTQLADTAIESSSATPSNTHEYMEVPAADYTSLRPKTLVKYMTIDGAIKGPGRISEITDKFVHLYRYNPYTKKNTRWQARRENIKKIYVATETVDEPSDAPLEILQHTTRPMRQTQPPQHPTQPPYQPAAQSAPYPQSSNPVDPGQTLLFNETEIGKRLTTYEARVAKHDEAIKAVVELCKSISAKISELDQKIKSSRSHY